MFILCAKCLCVKETLSNSLSTGSCKCKWEDSFVIESSILRHNLSATDFFSQRFHLHKKEFPDQKVLMEAVVFGCCLVLVRRREEVIYTGPTAANLLRLLFPLMRIGVV